MEPFEWLLLGAGLAVGAMFGANSKSVMRTAARGYLTLGEKTREWAGNMREDFQDALEEARYDREESEYEAAREEPPQHRAQPQSRQRSTSSRSRSSGRNGTRAKGAHGSARSTEESRENAGAQTQSD